MSLLIAVTRRLWAPSEFMWHLLSGAVNTKRFSQGLWVHHKATRYIPKTRPPRFSSGLRWLTEGLRSSQGGAEQRCKLLLMPRHFLSLIFIWEKCNCIKRNTVQVRGLWLIMISSKMSLINLLTERWDCLLWNLASPSLALILHSMSA